MGMLVLLFPQRKAEQCCWRYLIMLVFLFVCIYIHMYELVWFFICIHNLLQSFNHSVLPRTLGGWRVETNIWILDVCLLYIYIYNNRGNMQNIFRTDRIFNHSFSLLKASPQYFSDGMSQSVQVRTRNVLEKMCMLIYLISTFCIIYTWFRIFL